MGSRYPVDHEESTMNGCGCIIFVVVLACILIFWPGGQEKDAEPVGEVRDAKVVIHTVENQTLTVTPDEGREAYVVGAGKIVGSFRFIPIAFVDSPGRRELLTVPKSVELPTNMPVKLRFLQVSNGLLGDVNYVLELVEPSFE